MTFVQTFWVLRRLLFKNFDETQDFRSIILNAKQDFCSNILDVKEDFCLKIWVQTKLLFKHFGCFAYFFEKNLDVMKELLWRIFDAKQNFCSNILDAKLDFVRKFWMLCRLLSKLFECKGRLY